MYISNFKTEDRNIKKRVGRRAYFAILIAMSACAMLMLTQFLLSNIFAPIFKSGIDKSTSIIFEMIIYVASFVFSFVVAHIIFKTFFKNESPYQAKRYLPQNPILYIFGSIGVGYVCNLFVQLLFNNFSETYSVEIAMPVDTPLSIFLYYISIALLPAIFEEYAFRHVLLTNLLPFGKWGAIICSSILFGIVHIDPPRVIFATIFGLCLAVCREYTGSLIVPMIIHFINNAISVTITIAPIGSSIHTNVALSIYVFMFCGIAMLIYYPRKGLNNKKISLIKSKNYGYRLSFPKFFLKFLFNFGLIPLGLVYYLFFYLYFLA